MEEAGLTAGFEVLTDSRTASLGFVRPDQQTKIETGEASLLSLQPVKRLHPDLDKLDTF